MEKSNATKRKKEKCNEEAPQKADKRKVLKHDWQQTDSEVTITLFVGQSVNIKDVRLECTDETCTVLLQDGRMFSCEFFRSVVSEGTDMRQKGAKVIIKMVKRAPQTWKSLQKVDEELEDEKEKEEQQDGEVDKKTTDVVKYEDNVEDSKPVLVLEHIKHDWYERNQVLSLNVYVPQISKDAFSADFQEDHFILRFQTSDQKFLKLNSATDDSIFLWKVNLIDAIIPKECTFKVSNLKVEVFLKKKTEKQWSGLEKIPDEKALPVANSGWLPAAAAPQKKSSTIFEIPSDSTAVENNSKSVTPSKSVKKTLQKPTCLVSPLTRDSEPVKGMSGLDNLGNTCFMNSVLQCLANTREFRDYFLGSHFQCELNMENPLGTGGHLAVAFATLLRMLWSGNQSSLAPSKMKMLISQKAAQFAGFAQHDAQELMAFLLDGLHEDLNRVKKKPYVENVDYDGQPDEVAAEESWKQYKRRNDSVVVDLFQGQYKSRLQCPICQKVSITFDPFLYLSLPLPKRLWSLPVYFVSLDSSQKPLKLILHLSQDASVDEVKEKVASQVSIKPKNLYVVEVSDHRPKKFHHLGSSLGNLKTCETIVLYEMMDEDLTGEPVLVFTVFQRTMIPAETSRCSFCQKECSPTENKLKRCTKCYRDAYCDQLCQKNHWPMHKGQCKLVPELVGCPFVISLPESRATYNDLMRKMEAYSRYSVDVFQPPVSPPKHFGSVESCESPGNLTRSNSNSETASLGKEPVLSEDKLEKGTCPSEMENEKQDTKEETSYEDQSLSASVDENSRTSTCMVIGQPNNKDGDRSLPLFQIRLVDEMGQNLTNDMQPDLLPDTGDDPLPLKSASYLAMDWRNSKKEANYALVQSKNLDFEWLNPRDAKSSLEPRDATLENCLHLFTEPEVLSPQEAWYCPHCKSHREATKELSLWRLPPVLIIQLKRFSFNNLIWRDKIDKMVHFPVRGLDLQPYVQKPSLPGEAPPIYDLFAVINHTGNILGGHYTAYARLPDTADSRRNTLDWRVFDDSYVSRINDCEIVSRAAYVLFYRRRKTPVNLFPLPASILASKESKERENSKIHVQDTTDSNLLELSLEDTHTISDNNLDGVE